MLRRRSMRAHLTDTGAALAYVVGREREWLTDGVGRVAVHVGLLHAHRATGASHPLVRALSVDGTPPGTVIDATLGLCQDALHVAEVTGARMWGTEVSAPLFCLAESGLPRLAAEGVAAAARITPLCGDARQLLPTLPQADAVMLSPMFGTPAAAAPGFELLREVAVHAPLDHTWLAACLAAAPRVVMKVERRAPVPAFVTPHLTEVLHGKSVDYWLLERAGGAGTT
ncbi:MAG: class I SAM-dependent methyltransferase [Myxococcales bacterium]|nr:class I SAM-dependent methyltransferase [Myxococcales bacterium]